MFDFDFLVPIVVVGTITLGIYKLFELFVCRRERMMMIERMADLRDIDSGNKGNDRWRAEDKVEKLMVEDIDCQYLYSDGTDAYFMNLTTYEQFTVSVESLGEQMKFLAPEMMVKVNFVEGQPVSVSLPKTVIATVEETEPALKGQTVSNSGGKPAILDNGVRVQVPLFIEIGNVVRIDTRTGEYQSRVSN